jgi:DNA-binding NarL/FixJ family response regulator
MWHDQRMGESAMRGHPQAAGIAALVAEGRHDLARGDWAGARRTFACALEIAPGIEAYDGLGVAARYQLDAEAAFAAHEAGYRLARDGNDPDAAARLAMQLSYDSYAFRGPAEAMGWAERAAMLVAGRPPTLATAFVPFVRAYMALLARHDPLTARTGSAEAAAVARAVGATDLELLSVALEGLALVAMGDIDPGMAKLDAAAAGAVGGEMTDADSIETVCCFVIDACKRVRDLERANEWCLRVREIATRFGDRQMFSVCRVHYADVLLWQGALGAADAELRAAAEELGRIRPGREADALVRLAELRRRQGRLNEAEEHLALSTGHRMHALVTGLAALDRGDGPGAVEAADRFLRRVGDADLFERVAGLELVVRAQVAVGDLSAAQVAADEIASIAARTSSTALRAASLLAAGRIARARGDLRRACRDLEDAADLYESSEAMFDAAVARGELATTLGLDGRAEAARRADARARATLAAMGIAPPARESEALTAREVEVLRLVAQGLSNEDIAHRLVLSVRTVERHVANVYAKIGASGRTARAAATAWAHTRGIT